MGRKWESPPLIPLTHHVHKTDGHAVAASKLHHVFDGLGELANRGIQVSAATLWPLLRRRTPAAEHCGTYEKLKQDTQFCMLDLDVQTFLAPVVR